MISEGYEPVFIDIQTHIHLWDFIDYHIGTVDTEKDTLLHYLEYCHSSDIAPSLLLEYSDVTFNNLYDIFLNDKQSIFFYNALGGYIFLNHHDNGFLLDSENAPKGIE